MSEVEHADLRPGESVGSVIGLYKLPQQIGVGRGTVWNPVNSSATKNGRNLMNHKFDEMAKGLAQSVVRRTKNPLLLPVLVAVVTMLVACPSQAQFTYTTNNGTLTITGYTGTNDDVVIPSTIDGLSVTSVGTNAFAYAPINTVSIPNSVTNIGDGTFASCSSLTNVTIPNSVTSIGNGAFSASSLTSVTIPNSVTTIGYAVFDSCISLTSITIGNSVTNIGDHMFFGCSSLTNVILPNSVTSIGPNAFYDCYYLTSITIPNSVTNIGFSAFRFCTGLTSVTIPGSATSTSIGDYAFSYSGLTSVMIGNGVTNIGNYSFYYCTNLTSVTISYGLTRIGNFAFAGCFRLSGVTIPDSVTSIGPNAFYDCYDLTSVTIPNSVTSIGAEAFVDCTGLTNVTIGNGVTNIGSVAFAGCTSLTNVYFQGNAPSADSFAFPGNATAYYLEGTTGWGSTFDGIPTALWIMKAQDFTPLYPFTTPSGFGTNSDGSEVYAGLILSGNTLYGTASQGGSSGDGTVFSLNTNGTGFTVLHNFSQATGMINLINGMPNPTNSDGALPWPGLVLSGSTLYGTAGDGGLGGFGTVFAVNTDGTGFATLHDFTTLTSTSNDTPTYTNSDGGRPMTPLIVSGNRLYGTTSEGGSSASTFYALGGGTVFAVNNDGTGFATLHSFGFGAINPPTNSSCESCGGFTNSDGARPNSLALDGNTLYGTTEYGGSFAAGTVFRLNTDGTGFTILHNFTGSGDGGDPGAGLVLSGNTLYGATSGGGIGGKGTVFAVKTDGTGFTTLHSFTGGSGGPPFGAAGLVLGGNTLYGTTLSLQGGGTWVSTVFKLNTDGSGFRILFTFTDGRTISAPLAFSGNMLYGTADNGNPQAVIFSILVQPDLNIIRSGADVILSWPANALGTVYTLQATTNLLSPLWTTNLPAPVVLNGLNTVTNPISGTQQFFRLSQ
jgi:uncharacterized repeat protein (TIGR03803 family)